MTYLANERERLLAQTMWVTNVGEDNLLACFDALGRRKVNLATHRVFSVLHAGSKLLIAQDPFPGQNIQSSVQEIYEEILSMFEQAA